MSVLGALRNVAYVTHKHIHSHLLLDPHICHLEQRELEARDSSPALYHTKYATIRRCQQLGCCDFPSHVSAQDPHNRYLQCHHAGQGFVGAQVVFASTADRWRIHYPSASELGACSDNRFQVMATNARGHSQNG